MGAPEFELLLASARTLPDSGRIHQLVQDKVDWQAFWRLATHYNVRPLAFRSLKMICWSEVPDQSQQEWQEAIRIIAGRNLFLLGELIAIVQAMEVAGIEVCVLKGLLHGQILYGDVALRETNDLDLLIRKRDLPKAARTLRDMGYLPRSNVNIEQLPELLKYVGEYPFVGARTLVELDLHWRISHKAIALAPEWSDFPLSPQKLPLGGSVVPSIAIEELPLYLATQGGTDSWDDLRRVSDLAQYLLLYPNTDWSPIVAAVHRHHAERVLFVGLRLAGSFFGASLPPRMAESIPGTEGLAAKIANQMRQQKVPEALDRHVFQIQAKDGAVEKFKLLWSILTDRMMADAHWVPLPRSLWWLYRVLRPIRMIVRRSSSE